MARASQDRGREVKDGIKAHRTEISQCGKGDSQQWGNSLKTRETSRNNPAEGETDSVQALTADLEMLVIGPKRGPSDRPDVGKRSSLRKKKMTGRKENWLIQHSGRYRVSGGRKKHGLQGERTAKVGGG